jgi:hypothetical protein
MILFQVVKINREACKNVQGRLIGKDSLMIPRVFNKRAPVQADKDSG